MARKKTRKPKFTRLLNQSSEIIAIVDDEFKVLFANQACCDWLATTEHDLLASTLSYSSHSAADAAAAPTVNGICPPPSIFQSSTASTTGTIFTQANGKMQWKQACFVKITEPDFPLDTAMVIASGPDLDQPPTADAGRAGSMHQILAKLAHKHQQWFTLDSLICDSSSMQKARRQFAACAANTEDCLFVGPPGSGKERLARTLFCERNRLADQQLRKSQPTPSPQDEVDDLGLVTIHCSIADSQHIQSSIKEWAFDQRSRQSSDWLLLLDVDSLTTEAQVELLGYTQLPDFKIRMLATATSNLESLARAGQFIPELASYFSVQVIELPPLSQRAADIPLLIQYFIELNNQSSSKQIAGCTDEVIEDFLEYKWPGNMDELSQTIQMAHAAATKSTITSSDLPDEFVQGLSATQIGTYEPTVIDLEQYLQSIEAELIGRALKESRNNKTKAAKLLTVSRAKLLRRAAALNILATPKKEESADLIDPSAFKIAEQEPNQEPGDKEE